MEHEEGCTCNDCRESRRLFDAWCNDSEQRWEKARQEGRIAHHCTGVLCVVCGDPRDTSLDVYRLLHEVRS